MYQEPDYFQVMRDMGRTPPPVPFTAEGYVAFQHAIGGAVDPRMVEYCGTFFGHELPDPVSPPPDTAALPIADAQVSVAVMYYPTEGYEAALAWSDDLAAHLLHP